MSPSPKSIGDKAAASAYGDGWDDMMTLVRKGYSWSGHERGVCYLNKGTGRFANISYVSGLDFPDDSRALAVVDWDQDGDLDLWFRNRTAPRLRLMMNQHDPAEGGFVALRLEGTSANRDGIGAVVEVIPAPEGAALQPPMVKSLHAGDLFLSQSSKWLNFGLADVQRIQAAVVHWPGGNAETFRGLKPGKRYVLKQDSGEARAWQPKTKGKPTALADLSAGRGAGHATSSADATRIILPRRVAFPRLAYRNPPPQPTPLSSGVKARWLVFWGSWCPHCRDELAALTRAAATLRAAGVDILALSVDGLRPGGGNPSAEASRMIRELGFPFAWGLINAPSFAKVEKFQEALFDTIVGTSLPLSFLLDEKANVVVIYRGPATPETVAGDARNVIGATNEQLHLLAPPFAGRTFTRAVDDTTIAEFMARQFQVQFPEDALTYLHLAAESAAGDRRRALRRELGTKHHAIARNYGNERKPEQAAYHYQAALEFAPGSAEILCDFASLLGSYGELRAAEEMFRRALAVAPDHARARAGLKQVREIRAKDNK